jgi:hypothetical protein
MHENNFVSDRCCDTFDDVSHPSRRNLLLESLPRVTLGNCKGPLFAKVLFFFVTSA